MKLSENTTNLLTVVIVLLLVYFLYKNQNNAVHNEGSLTESDVNVDSTINIEVDSDDDSDVESDDESAGTEDASSQDESGEVVNSYVGTKRGNTGGNWVNQFNDNNMSTEEGNSFVANSNDDGLAPFESTGNTSCNAGENCDTNDLFNLQNATPQEKKSDWFETDTIEVSNANLLGAVKPYGISTNTGGIKSHDLRQVPVCPKYTVSPWLQSTNDPDTNLKQLT